MSAVGLRRRRQGWSELALLALLPFAVGTCLRVWYAASFYHYYQPASENEEGYYEAGVGLLSCKVLSIGLPETNPAAARGALFPGFIAAVESPFAHPNPGHVRMAQAALFSLAVLAVFFLGRALLSPLAGFIAAMLLALDPRHIESVALLNIHSFYGLALLALAAALARWSQSPDSRAGVLAALALAASLLCRAAHFPLPLLIVGAGLRWWGWTRRTFKALVLPAVLTLVFLSPRVTRDALHFHELVPLDGYAGSFVLLQGTFGPEASSSVEEDVKLAQSLEPGFRDPGLHDQLLQRELFRLARKNAAAHPLRWLGFCLQRLIVFWSHLWLPLLSGLVVIAAAPTNRAFQACFIVLLSLSGYAVAGGAPQHLVAADPLAALICGCGAAVLLSKLPFAARCPRLFRDSSRRVAGPLLALPVGLGVIYAVTIGFLAVEVNRYWKPHDPTPVATRAWCDGRDLDMLALGAVQSPRQDALQPIYDHYVVPHFLNLFKRGQYEVVERGLTRILSRDHEILGALRILADAFSAQGRFEEGLAFSERLLRAPGLSPKFRAEILAFRVKLQADRPRPIAPPRPTGAAALSQVASLLSASRLEEAAALLKDSIVDSRREPGTQAERGAMRAVLLTRLGRRAESRQEMKQALQRDADRTCHGTLGGLDRSQITADFFDACLERFPNDPSLLTDRGIARFLAGDLRGAAVDFRKTLELRPNQLQAAVSLATLLDGQGRGPEALEIIEKVLTAASAQRSTPLYAQAIVLRNALRAKP